MNYDLQYAADCAAVEEALDRAIPVPDDALQKTVLNAMRYSLLGGGKRIRAVLALETCAALGGRREAALPAACALEMVHAYSLIHDDLPCMDDDDMRRGKPSCHIAYGEAMAVLAGDGLQTCAFEMLSGDEAMHLLGAERVMSLVRTVSRAIGEYGMLGGQTADVENERIRLSADDHRDMVAMKTGALIRAAVLCGCICADAADQTTDIFTRFAETVGEAFQVTDDILDVVGDAAALGKPIGSDAAEGKNTFVTMLGLDGARKLESDLYADAHAILDSAEADTDFLREMLSRLCERKS